MPKKTFLYLAIALTVAFAAGFIYTQYLQPKLDNRGVTATAQMPVSSAVAPLMFKFPSGPDALALIEPPTGEVSDTGIKEVYLMMKNNEYQEFSKENGGNPPATISVFVLPYVEAFGAEEMKRAGKLQAWAIENSQFSSWAAAITEPESTEIDGVRAITYKTESVYKQDVYIALYDDDIYVFTGQYESDKDEILSMFNAILDSVILN